MDRTLEEFTIIKKSKSLTNLQISLFNVKDLKKGWFGRYKHNTVTEDQWEVAIRSIKTKENINRVKGGVRKTKHVYLMLSANGLYKIGISQEVYQRKNSISTASGFPVTLISYWSTGDIYPEEVEKSVHQHFKKYRTIGEWFNTNGHDISEEFDSFLRNMAGTKKMKVLDK